MTLTQGLLTAPASNHMHVAARHAGPITKMAQVVLQRLESYKIMLNSTTLKRKATRSRIGALWLAVGGLGR